MKALYPESCRSPRVILEKGEVNNKNPDIPSFYDTKVTD